MSWNLLTRTNNDFQYISLKLTLVYGLGIFVRYCILMPLRCTTSLERLMVSFKELLLCSAPGLSVYLCLSISPSMRS